MAELATIARPYAEALFRVAEAGDSPPGPTLVEELAQVARLPEVLSIATSPKVSRDQVSELLLAAVKSPLKDNAAGEESWCRCWSITIACTLMPEIAVQFDELKNAREGAADALIVSAFPLEGAQLNDLVAKSRTQVPAQAEADGRSRRVADRRRARDGRRRSARYLGPRAACQHADGSDRLTRFMRSGWHATELTIRSE